MKKQRKITNRKKEKNRYTESGKRIKKSTEEQKIYPGRERKKWQREKRKEKRKNQQKKRKNKKRSRFIHKTKFSIQISNESVRSGFLLYLFIEKMCHCARAASLLYENWNAMLLRNMNRVLYFHPLREICCKQKKTEKKKNKLYCEQTSMGRFDLQQYPIGSFSNSLSISFSLYSRRISGLENHHDFDAISRYCSRQQISF